MFLGAVRWWMAKRRAARVGPSGGRATSTSGCWEPVYPGTAHQLIATSSVPVGSREFRSMPHLHRQFAAPVPPVTTPSEVSAPARQFAAICAVSSRTLSVIPHPRAQFPAPRTVFPHPTSPVPAPHRSVPHATSSVPAPCAVGSRTLRRQFRHLAPSAPAPYVCRQFPAPCIVSSRHPYTVSSPRNFPEN